MKSDEIASMFNRISPTYDKINRLLSFGLDTFWRKKGASLLPKDCSSVLDLATGTGDQLFALLQKHPHLKTVGLDFAEQMLEKARVKAAEKKFLNPPLFIQGDALNVPFDHSFFHSVFISFGLRNVSSLEKCLSEMHRILKKDGKSFILEFSVPENRFLKSLYLLYLRGIVPLVGKLFSCDQNAYHYLDQSIEAFLSKKELIHFMHAAGFKHIQTYSLAFGAVILYVGQKV